LSFVDEELSELADRDSLFTVLDKMEGEVYRAVESRRTFRFEYRGRAYFAKLHFGVGWGEIFKNLVQLRLPVVGAANERRAIERLTGIGVDTMEPVAYVEEGMNPATRHSAIVTRELTDTISLEDLALAGPIPFALRLRLIRKVAAISREMHAHGVNHRDLYICHFHLDRRTQDAPEPRIHVIDLHRAQVRRSTPVRWVVKDIGGLLFSAADAGLGRRDLLRFMREYSGEPLAVTLVRDRRFWKRVIARARRLYSQEHGRPFAAEWRG